MKRTDKKTLPLMMLAMLLWSCNKATDPRTLIPGEKSNDTDTSVNTNPTSHTVIVIGNGFVPDLSNYKDQISASYTVSCNTTKLASKKFSFSSDEAALKESVKTWIKDDPKACTLTEGITYSDITPFDTITDSKTAWNDGLQATPAAVASSLTKAVKKVLHPEESWRNYEGTAAAAVIAYDNPAVKLVLIEVNPEVFSDFNGIFSGDCPKQTEVDALATALGDDEIKSLYSKQALHDFEETLFGLSETHAATLIVNTLLPPHGTTYQSYLKIGKCDETDFSALFSAFSVLESERLATRFQDKSIMKRVPLILTPAGNNSQTVSDNGALRGCNGTSYRYLQIGAADRDEKLATYSANGSCVDYYVPAEALLTAAPHDFLDAWSGSDMATALLARHIAHTYEPSDDPEDWLKQLDKLKDDANILPYELLPDALRVVLDKSSAATKDGLTNPLYLHQTEIPFDFKTLRAMPFIW